jgi:hypothetical protein
VQKFLHTSVVKIGAHMVWALLALITHQRIVEAIYNDFVLINLFASHCYVHRRGEKIYTNMITFKDKKKINYYFKEEFKIKKLVLKSIL